MTPSPFLVNLAGDVFAEKSVFIFIPPVNSIW